MPAGHFDLDGLFTCIGHGFKRFDGAKQVTCASQRLASCPGVGVSAPCSRIRVGGFLVLNGEQDLAIPSSSWGCSVAGVCGTVRFHVE